MQDSELGLSEGSRRKTAQAAPQVVKVQQWTEPKGKCLGHGAAGKSAPRPGGSGRSKEGLTGEWTEDLGTARGTGLR